MKFTNLDRIIFLDIDGVLNHQQFYESIDWAKRKSIYDDFGEGFCPISSKILNRIIDETKAKIVISSSWRHDGLQRMQEMWVARKMSGEVIDITPFSETRFRGLEIQEWLEKKRNFQHINWCQDEQMKRMVSGNIANYIIIDDDSDMTYTQRNHFIHVLPSPRNYSGFNYNYGIQALKKMKSDIITLNYSGITKYTGHGE